MSDINAFHASLRAAHDSAEAQRVELAKVRDELAAANQKAMEETIKRLEAEKTAIAAQNTTLQKTADAAKAEAAKAEAASGECNMAVVDSVLRICVWRREVEKTGPDNPAIQGL